MRIETQRFSGRDARLSVSLLLPPLVALGAQWLCYSLVHQGCVHDSKAALYLIKAAALVGCVYAFVLARGVKRELEASPLPDDRAWQRASFQANGGQVFGAFFFLLIVAMAIPDLLLRVCD